MTLGSLIWLWTLPMLPIRPGDVLPHSIWNQISSFTPALRRARIAASSAEKFF